MKYRSRWLLLSTTLFLLFVCVSPLPGQEKQEKVPSGDWSITVGPYLGPGYETSPVQLISVSGVVAPDNRLVYGRYRFKNRADFDARETFLSFFVYKWPSRDLLLVKDVHYGSASLSNNVSWGPRANSYWPANAFPDVPQFGAGLSFEYIADDREPGLLGSFVKDGKLEGRFHVAVGVTKVIFEDDSVWELDIKPGLKVPKKSMKDKLNQP